MKRVNQTVYLFEPKAEKGAACFQERNTGLAKYFARVTGRRFGGEFTLQDAGDVPDDAFWFLHGVITPADAEESLHIQGSNFYGGVMDLLYAEKSVFHQPVPNAEYIPAHFPHEYVSYLNGQGILSPGYTAFTVRDIERAYELLDQEGYVVRFKDPLQSSKKGQYRLESKKQLLKLIESLDEAVVAKYGIVLEVNMVPVGTNELVSTSGCWFDVDGQTYMYIGSMNFEENITPFSYVGTDMFLTKQGTPTLIKTLPGRYDGELKMLEVFKEANKLLPNFKATRCNYNFIQGAFELKNGSDGAMHVCATEPTYRPGGATVAELLGMEHLNKHPGKDVVHVRSRMHYGPESEAGITPSSVVVYRPDSSYAGPGRDGRYINVAAQAFADVLD